MHQLTDWQIIGIVTASFWGGVILTVGFGAWILKAANNFNPFK